MPLVSRATVEELTRVLAYPKFRLSAEDRRELLADYIPYCEVVERTERCAAVCRDGKDQPFLDLAQSGHAEVLVTGDRDLLVLAGQTRSLIETPEAYRHRTSGAWPHKTVAMVHRYAREDQAGRQSAESKQWL